MENDKPTYQVMDDSDCIFTEEQVKKFYENLRKFKLWRFPFLNDTMSNREMDEKIKEFWDANPEEKQKFDDSVKKTEDMIRNRTFFKQNNDD